MKHFAIRKLSKILTLLLLIISGKLCYGDTVSIPFRYYQYDALNGNSWNRMQKITYPDGEVVSYGYDGGGNLLSMSGTKNNATTNYIRKIHYNEQGKRDYIKYGNGVKTQ